MSICLNDFDVLAQFQLAERIYYLLLRQRLQFDEIPDLAK